MRKLILALLLLLTILPGVKAQPVQAMPLAFKTTGASNGYLTETNTFLASDATLSGLSTTIKDGIDRWFRDLQGYANGSYTTYNVWSRIVAIYPMIGGTSTSSAVNAKSPGTYNLTHTGSPTITSSGIAYNGSSQYSNTGLTPSNSGTTSDVICWGVHRRDANDDGNATWGIATGGNSYFIARADNFRSMLASGNNLSSGAGTLGVNALWHAGYTSTTAGSAYRNGVNIKSNTGLTLNNCGTASFYIGACHTGSVLYGGANTVDYVWLANGTWTDAEQTFMYNAFNALQTILSR